MEDRRTGPVWFKQDAADVATGVSRRLGRLHGAAGIVAWVHLKGCAKLQEGFHDRKGTIKIAWDELAEAICADSEEHARAIVSTLVEMDEAEVVADRGWKVTLFLTGYERSQRAASAGDSATRMREKRERDRQARLAEARALGIDLPDDASMAAIERAIASHVTPGDEPCAHAPSHVTPGDVEVDAEGEGDAAAAAAREPDDLGALHPAHREVVPILAAAREPTGGALVVEPASIDSQLRAHVGDRCPLPADERLEVAVQAAHETAAIVKAGTNSTSDATRLFGGVLQRAVERRRYQGPRRHRAGAPPGRAPTPPSSTVAAGDQVIADLVRGR